jgi:uncharacterized RDD family membrane protein YckC
MRCPKCQYITFDSDDRCRNCGYEFALSSSSADQPVDVRIARDEPESVRRGADAFSALDTPLTGASAAPDRAAHAPGARRGMTPADLPLFIESVADDQAPLVTPPTVPRAPLAVRQAPTSDHAGVARRVGAGVIDVTILGSIAAGVVLLTLRVSQLTVEQWRVLPLAPMAAFLLLLCGGYFVLFTAAGGQTIGKMATGIRVVNAADNQPSRVSFRTAVVRTVSCLGSVLALGTGFLPVLFSGDRRAFHDRVAETRVVGR